MESWGVGRDVWISLKLFLEVVIKQKPALIPETKAHFNRLTETSRSPHVTASKQTMQNIVIMTVESSPETLKNVCGHLRKQTSPLISSI